MIKILVFGDSIAWGAFDCDYGGWVERLKTKYFKSYREGSGINVYNLSISSNDTKGVLHNLEKQLDIFNNIEPEEYVFLFSIGSNDPIYVDTRENINVPFKEFKDNLKKIVKLSKKYTSKIIFTGLLIVDEDKTKPWSENEYWENKDLKKYNDTIEKICKENSLDFIPLWDLLNKNDLKDGLHPNALGHQKIFNRINEYCQKSKKLR